VSDAPAAHLPVGNILPVVIVDSGNSAWYDLGALSAGAFLNNPLREEQTMTQRSMLGWSVAVVLMIALPAWAVEYRLQVVNLNFLDVSAYTDRPQPGQPGEGTLVRLQTRLDRMEFPTTALIPDRDMLLLQDPAYGGKIPERVSVLPTTREQAWTTFVFDANPGDTVAFVVKTYMVGWQQIWMLGANPEGTLRRLTPGNPSFFGGRSYEVPQVSYDFLANAVGQGTFAKWMAQNAPSLNGMFLVIGQGRSRFYDPDRLFVVLKLAPDPRTYQVVIGWRDHNNRGDGNNIKPIN
jgi:hypothetical protein